MEHEFEHPLIGQRCIIRSSAKKGYIGTVVDWVDEFPHQSISIKHPVTSVVVQYSPHNVELLAPDSSKT